jgi:hypothetical protein
MSIPARMRLVAAIFICGGLVAFFYMYRIASWERADGDFIVPGSNGQSHVKPEILPLLGQIGGAVIGLGIVLLILAQIRAWRIKRAVADGRPLPVRPQINPVRRIAMMFVVIAVAMLGTFGFRWYQYVTNTDSPYDEVGIDINSRLPEPLRAWGCAQLHQHFAQSLPPYGCADETGRVWR